MNYRHAFHAGNFVDCAKHLLLIDLLLALQRKDAGYVVIETHAGAGWYALDGAEARATGEADAGVQRLATSAGPMPEAAQHWLRLLRTGEPDWGADRALRRYPGSPVLAARLARPQDRLVCCELVAAEAERLALDLGTDGRVEVGDGYRALRGLIPPPERRGLVFIDPPYEAPDETRQAAEALLAGVRRWPSGVFALWYPIKDAAAVAGMLRRIQAGLPPKTLCAEFRRVPDGRAPGLTGSGLLVVNPPYRFAEEATAALRWLAHALGESEAVVGVSWLVAER